MSERDKREYLKLKSDPAKYSAFVERKRAERAARGPEYESRRKAAWRAANPNAASRIRKANHAVETALKNGALIRPDRCESCGAECIPEGHHDSYAPDKWLVVRWLCQMCHSAAHHPRC